jgi:gliding motility-associated-like protein
MKKYIIVLLSFLSAISFGNAQLCLGEDTTVCVGQPVVITNCGGGGGAASTAGIQLNAPINVPLSDDVWSGVINIGFPFNFYGTNYNQCLIGSNGLISFNLANAGGYCSWSLSGTPLPTTSLATAFNTIMLAYQDMNPGAGGSVKYQTIGTAPNRKFIVLYQDVPQFGPTGFCNYMGIVLYETSNTFEFHIGNKLISPTWNGGLAIQGSENNPGNIAHITPGRNNSQWTANQDGRRFTPVSPANTSSYAISIIPYIVITSPTMNLGWQNTLGATFPYNNGILNVTTVPPGTTGYFLTGTACTSSIGGVSDTTWITRVSSSVTASSTPDICSSGLGTVTATPTGGIPPFTYNWPALSSINQTVLNVNGGNYTVQMIDGNGCPSSANILVGNTPAAFTGTTTIVSCPGGSDGTATAIMTPPLGTITYLWNDPLAQTTAMATGLSAGNYTCLVTSSIGCTGTVNVTVTEIPGMIGTIVNQSEVSCNSGNNGMIEVQVSQGTPIYSYSWDNSVSTTNIANDLFEGIHTVTITDLNGCVITVTETIGEPSPLSITTLTSPTQICPEDDIQLDVAGTGGSSAYTFTWRSNGAIIGTGTTITVDPGIVTTEYCVTLSEVCGSPIDDSCTIISIPVPIIPSVLPNKTEDCIPGFFEFSNTSSNSSEIASTYFLFSDGNSYMEQGTDSTSNTFVNPNLYSCYMTITSIYGCVYEDSFINLIDVKPLPTADFTFSSNPATFFETAIQLQDRSSVDVVEWQWLSPGATPAYSQAQNPVFTFPEGEAGIYPVTLIVTSEYGCTDTAIINMNIVPDVIFFAANTFTPDGDEHNQDWGISVEGLDIYNFDLFIFNRWGQIVWESHDTSAKWDGTYNGEVVQAGTYVWKASGKDTLTDGKYEFNGYINVLK